MEISLISPYSALFNNGLRTISAVLKNAGFKTKMFFLPMPSADSGWNASPFSFIKYPEILLNELKELTGNSQIIGLSLMDNYLDVGIDITNKLKRDDNLIIWGGALTTLNPELGLKYADCVCIGDGEYALLKLAQMVNLKNITPIPNIYFRQKDFPELQCVDDLAKLPPPDYGPSEHYVYVEAEDDLLPLKNFDDYQLFFQKAPDPNTGKLSYIYRMETSRGCPHNCTYCVNNILKKMQSPKMRFKSIIQIETELNLVKENMPFVTSVSVEDDCFMARRDLKELAALFKHFGYTYRCLISPVDFKEDLMNELVERGLIVCHMGLQSAHSRIVEMYRRTDINRNSELVLKYFKDKEPQVKLFIDILVDNPWEKIEETLYTLSFLLKSMPKRAALGINSLVFYFGTELWRRAKKENRLEDNFFLKTWHWHRQKTIRYTTVLFVLLKFHFPRTIIKILASKLFVYIFERRVFTSFFIPKLLYVIKRLQILKKPKSLQRKPELAPIDG